MKKKLTLFTISALVLSSNAGTDNFNDDVLEAKQLSKIDAQSLSSVPAKKIVLYPQYSVRLNDKMLMK
jgi:hypothetical protein